MAYNTYVPAQSYQQQPQQPIYQPQQQQSQGSPLSGLGQLGLNAYKSGLFSNSATVGGGEAAFAGPQTITMPAAGATSGSAAGGGAASGASSGGGMLASAGPWAALAAVIMANESEANKAGRRDEDRTSRGVDMLSGAVLEQDADYYGDKVGGPLGRSMAALGSQGNPEGQFNFAKKTAKNVLTPWKIFS